MDYSKLKRRPPFPFETIGVAVAFSPRLEALLGEAKRLADVFHAKLLLMHIGERTSSKEARLEEVFRRLNIDTENVQVIWRDGPPVPTLLELCKENIVDLLLLGAIKKENVLRFYLGSVARQISRKAKCSVLLLIDPNRDGTRFRKIMVNGAASEKTLHTINTAVYFAQHVGAQEITVATECNEQGLAMFTADDSTAGEVSKMKKEFNEEEVHTVHELVVSASRSSGIDILEKQIKGKPGFAIRQYAESKKSDLLVINSPDVKYGLIDRIFTHDLEYILEDLSTNVLIVHSRVTEP